MDRDLNMDEMSAMLEAIGKLSPSQYTIFNIPNNEILCTLNDNEGFLGYTIPEMNDQIRNGSFDFLHSDDKMRYQKTYNSLAKDTNEVVSVNLRLKHKQGSYSWFNLKQTCICWNTDGSPLLVLSKFIDVDDLMKTQSKLKDQLQVLKEISFKNSHELRAPVSNMLGLLEAMDTKFFHEEQRQIFDFMKVTVSKLDLVIRDFNEYLNREEISFNKAP